jgi:hypothetical protein
MARTIPRCYRVLPNQHRRAEGRAERQCNGADTRRDEPREEQHDDEDRCQRGAVGDKQGVFAIVHALETEAVPPR